MPSLSRTLLAATLLTAAGPLAACSQDSVGTSIKVALSYNDASGLDTAEVTLGNRTQSARISHELLLLVPDELAGAEMPIEVWGEIAGKRSAYGAGSAVPTRGKTVATSLTLLPCTPGCQAGVLTTCTGPAETCVLGCASDGEPRCTPFKPSNGVDPAAADPLRGTTTISADTTFNTSTGAITGGLSRPGGIGTDSSMGIGYVQADASGNGGAQLGMFVFHDLTIAAGATVHVTGGRAAVLLVGGSAKIAGVIDVAARHSGPGPGGGAGGSDLGPAQGCGAGGPGVAPQGMQTASGGGGGGGGLGGSAGGRGGTIPGGGGGSQCMPALLEPLQGGSGGGRGSSPAAASVPSGGSGGGALQITALGSLEITGTINAGGAGGDGEPGPVVSSSGGGGGGGGGGGILLEAPVVTVRTSAILAANGGGGGGGGGTAMPSLPGDDASASATKAAAGGGGGEINEADTGGAGGIQGSPPDVGGDGQNDGGGGGGAVGVIAIRARTLMLAGTVSPQATQADIAP